jgi:hypothetical protein
MTNNKKVETIQNCIDDKVNKNNLNIKTYLLKNDKLNAKRTIKRHVKQNK